MDTIIIVIKDSDDCLRLKEFLSSDYHIVICSELENIIDNLNDNRIVAIIMDLDDATEVNVAKYSSYKNIDNIQIPLIVGGNFTGNLLNLLNLGVSEVIVKPYNEAIIKLRINNAIRRAEDNEYRIMADFDTLTKIYNRTAFYREAKKLITQNQDINYDLACFDIDRFKIINDIYGSSVGDELLIYIANTGVKRMKKLGGLIGRLSGDLFAIVVPHQANIEDLLLQQMNEDIGNFDLGIKVVVSFGYYNIDDFARVAEENNRKKEREAAAAADILEDYRIQFKKWMIFQKSFPNVQSLKEKIRVQAEDKGMDKALSRFFFALRESFEPKQLEIFMEALKKVEESYEED